MIKYEVGKQFPHTQYLHRGELTTSMLNTAFFDVVCVLNGITAEEKKDWKKGKLSVSLYEKNDTPFIIFKFEDWSFDVNININKVQEKDIENWLNSEANTINLYLVEESTGELEAMRLISIPLNLAEKIKDICEKQTEKTTEQVDLMIKSVLELISTDMMIKNAIASFKVK